jgi:diguanylate cyclase (GGDEF)-like protein
MKQGESCMEAPKIPENEAERMAALEKLNIVDTPIQENFERITRITKSLFNVPIAAFTLIDGERQWFKSIQGLDVCETSREVSFCGHVINQDEIMIINDALLDPRFADNPLVIGPPFIRFYAGCPVLSTNGLKMGSLCIIDTKPHNYTATDLAQLKDMAKLAEIEINSSQNEYIQKQLMTELERAKRQALVDGLTRLWNRAGIEAIIKKQEAQSSQKQENFGIALIDIDNFKAVNDTYGHNTGDAILRAVAKRLLSSYRLSDSVGRWGGEEFLVVLGSGDQENFFEIADQARINISSTPIEINNLEITITITTGLSYADWQKPGEIISLVSKADKALYEGKIMGKNVVKISLDIKEKK